MKWLGNSILAFASCSRTFRESALRHPTTVCAASQESRLSRRVFIKDGVFFGWMLPWMVVERTEAMITDPKTGISFPSEGEIETAIPLDWKDVDNPFEDVARFDRLDSSPDDIFYTEPRFVEHVDAGAVQILTEYISNDALHEGDSVLDLCSSWTSHIDTNQATKLKRVAGLGMNGKELSDNPVLTDWTVHDLNLNPQLPYEDNSFNVVLCQLSIDYLTRPKQVLKEVARVLKPGGTIHVLFSNRLFLSKVRIFTTRY